MKTRVQKDLAYLMNKLGLTQADLARSTGIHQSALSTYINGKRAPAIANLIKLTKFAKRNGLKFSWMPDDE